MRKANTRIRPSVVALERYHGVFEPGLPESEPVCWGSGLRDLVCLRPPLPLSPSREKKEGGLVAAKVCKDKKPAPRSSPIIGVSSAEISLPSLIRSCMKRLARTQNVNATLDRNKQILNVFSKSGSMVPAGDQTCIYCASQKSSSTLHYENEVTFELQEKNGTK